MKAINSITKKTNEWGVAIKITPKAELVKLALTSMFENTYYENIDNLVERTEKYINKVEPEWLLKLAIFGRNYGLKSINHFLFVLAVDKLTWVKNARELVKNAFTQFVWTPNDVIEILNFYKAYTGKKPNKLLKSAIKDLFENDKFDIYQIAKWESRFKNQKKNWKSFYNLVDVVRLVHPRNNEIVNKLVHNNLPSLSTLKTAEAVLSDTNLTNEELISFVKEKIWDKALLMYLRTLLNRGIFTDILAEEINRRQFKGLFPFDFLRAISVVEDRQLQDALVNQASKALYNLPLSKNIIVGVDTSGSMCNNLSEKSVITYRFLASFYGALINKEFKMPVYAWSTYAKKVENLNSDILENTKNIEEKDVGWGTNIQGLLEKVIKNEGEWKKLIIFTDAQFTPYNKDLYKKFKRVWYFNLAWYENSIQVKNNIVECSGFSDIMFKVGADVLNINPLLKEIDNINL